MKAGIIFRRVRGRIVPIVNRALREGRKVGKEAVREGKMLARDAKTVATVGAKATLREAKKFTDTYPATSGAGLLIGGVIAGESARKVIGRKVFRNKDGSLGRADLVADTALTLGALAGTRHVLGMKRTNAALSAAFSQVEGIAKFAGKLRWFR